MASVSNVALFVLLCAVIFGEGSTSDNKEQTTTKGDATRLQDILVVVRSQPNSFHKKRAELFKAMFLSQLAETDQEEWPSLETLDEWWPDVHVGYWAFLPILPQILEMYGGKSWIFLCEEDTRVDIFKLLEIARKYDHNKMHFLGRALRDETAVIIHHFAFAENPKSFAYPDFGAGVLFSMPLIKWLAAKARNGRNFVIDVQHEIAKTIFEDGEGKRLTHIPQFCTVPREGCITYLADRFVECGPPIPEEDIFVAVKTCSKFHESRVPIVKKTWGKETSLIEYYSDVADPSIPTVDLGIPNTERGHCGKTLAILKRAAKKGPSRRPWLLIADDDTIISLQRLRQLLACYNSSEVVHLGERYGFNIHDSYGYSYITGGGGMVFSRPAVQLLKDLDCVSNDAPDDMALGRFFGRTEHPITHSFHFHQGRLEDYSKDFLAGRLHVSFHKHWNSDPLKTYAFLMKGIARETRRDEL